MKFTKTAFRAALKANDQTEVWRLVSLKIGSKPTRTQVYNAVVELSTTSEITTMRRARKMAYGEGAKKRMAQNACIASWAKRGGMRQYSQKTEALAMLRRLLTEKPSNYTKVPMMGHTHLYFCSPSYGHADYNKVCTCNIEGNEEFVNKIVKIGKNFMAKHNI